MDGSVGTGGTSGTGGTGGTAGSAGSGGSAGTNGSAGTGGTAGQDGSVGTGGQDAGPDSSTGGTSGTAGTNGASGTSGTGGTSGSSGTGGSAGQDAGPDGTSGTGGRDGGTDGGSDAGDSGANCAAFPTVTNFANAGPYTTTSGAGGSTCTIYRPSTLGQGGVCHPIIIWGNGTGASPSTYAAVLTHWASHGFIVAAANTSNAGTGEQMLACLDYVVGQNNSSGSVYFRRVDVGHVGASGHSQGGGGTLMAGRDARITVTAPLEPYTQQGFGGFQQSSIGQQRGSMFLMSGSADTIATPNPNQSRVYNGTNVPVFWGTLAGADHIVSGTGNISGFRGPATAWFRYHLMGDQSARNLFYGASCGLCTNGSWTVQRKGIN
jgi:hypothetical protein